MDIYYILYYIYMFYLEFMFVYLIIIRIYYNLYLIKIYHRDFNNPILLINLNVPPFMHSLILQLKFVDE